MLEKIDNYTRKYLDKGNLGESFVKWYCIENNLTYKKATFEENNYQGIDAYIEGIPTDIKNTRGIYFLRFYKDSQTFYVRHPFRANTKCKNYLILEIEDNKSFIIKYNGPIEEYLIENYFINDKAYSDFLKYIKACDKTKPIAFSNIEGAIFEKKKTISIFLKEDIICHYNSINSNEKEISMKLISKQDKEKENEFLSKLKKG